VVNTARPAQPGYRVGYERTPRLGVIETLHALDPATGHAMCDRPVAISWSAEEAADTVIDCAGCLSVVEQRERRA
jgi:hypothetical protein